MAARSLRKRPWVLHLQSTSVASASVPQLIIEYENFAAPAEIERVLAEQFRSGGMTYGMLYVGTVTASPDMAYLLWHFAGEVPISTMVPKDDLKTSSAARIVAQEFLMRWNQRHG
jgi:hypothetical protein